MKRTAAMILTAILLITGTALAGTQDRMILQSDGGDLYYSGYLQEVILAEEKAYLFVSGVKNQLIIYDLTSGESETFSMQEMRDRMEGLTVTENEADAENSFGTVTEEAACWFLMNGGIYAVVNRSTYSDESNQLDGGHVRKLIISEGKADLAGEDTVTLNWSGMTETAGSWEMSKYISSSDCDGERLYLLTYDDAGNQSLITYDLTSGEMTETMMPDLADFRIGPDGKILLCGYDWSENSAQTVSLFDPATESTEELIRFDLNEGSVSSIVYLPETDTICYVRNGEIFSAPDRDLKQAAPVNDCPVSGQSFADLTADGRMLVWNYNAAVLRSLDPAQRSAVTLRIRPYTWSNGLDSAIYRFIGAHSDVAVVREDFGEESALLQAMMNRDGQVDVFLMQIDSTAYNAIFDRGFMKDLSGDSGLTEATGRMYPFVKEILEKDGRLMAVPIGISGDGIGYNRETLEKAGMSEADLPTTWDQYFEFLQELPARLAGTDLRAFDLYTDRDSLKTTLMHQILLQYSLTRPDASMNSEELRGLLTRIQQIDFGALGILTEEELEQVDTEDRYEEMGGMQPALLTTYAEFQMGSYEGATPLLLTLREGEEPVLPVEMGVAFINPYSAHAEEAMSFLETLLENQDSLTLYSLNPDRNEAVRYPNHEEMRRTLQKWLDSAKRSLETAEEEDREMWASIVEEYEKSLTEYDDTNWLISPKNIELYRVRAGYLKPVTWNYYNALNSAEGGEEYWMLRQRYLEGTATAAEMLSFIDKKVQMMRLEGN